MDDELEDKILYQAYLLHLKLASKFTLDIPSLNVNVYLTELWYIMRVYLLKPEVFFFATLVFAVLFYLQTINIFSRSFLEKLGRTTAKVSKLQLFLNNNVTQSSKKSWELRDKYITAYAIQGHRNHMEDRFVVNSNIDNTGVSIFAIFDGHGGEFAANYARDHLIPNLNSKVIELKNLLNGKSTITSIDKTNSDKENQVPEEVSIKKQEMNTKTDGKNCAEKRKSFRKTISNATDDYSKKKFGITDPELLSKLDSLQRPISREVRPLKEKALPKIELSSYIEGDKVNYGKLLTDEILATDRLLVEAAKKNMNVAGSTALVALLEGNKLIVANVGDSRGVMCDGRGNAIPLSFDHKPNQQREKTRINKAGGLVLFNGVWRVAGILATSRALGDYPLKDKKLVIAEPDILTFDLNDHNAAFLVLASDGLWDTFSNEEAIAFIKERLDEPHFGAKSITLTSYHRGSLDNITVMIINLKERMRECPGESSKVKF